MIDRIRSALGRPSFGLRPRLAGAMLATSALTLLVAAALVLSPLQQRLRRNAESTLRTTVQESRGNFRTVPVRDGEADLARLSTAARALSQRAGARVAVLDPNLIPIYDSDPDIEETFDDGRQALRTGQTQSSLTGNLAQVAVPVRIGGQNWAIAARKPLGDVAGAARDVERAFVAAGTLGLVVALLFGYAFAAALLRRLARLRDAARDLDAAGGTTPVPPDDTRDELGEVTRAFSAMQTRVRLQEDARREFVSTASHELRTPLASLHGMLELLEEELRDSQPDMHEVRSEVTKARVQSDRLNSLATDLLDLSKVDAGLELRREQVELGEICRAVTAEFDARAAARQAHVVVRGADKPCWAMGDPTATARTVRILVDNALRFTPAGNNVLVAVGTVDGFAEVVVHDAGPGIPADETAVIFERFRRGSEPGTGAGFGLGLAIGRQLVRSMGGTLELDSSAAGARFVMRLAAG